jgi:hypothetical protein
MIDLIPYIAAFGIPSALLIAMAIMLITERRKK